MYRTENNTIRIAAQTSCQVTLTHCLNSQQASNTREFLRTQKNAP